MQTIHDFNFDCLVFIGKCDCREFIKNELRDKIILSKKTLNNDINDDYNEIKPLLSRQKPGSSILLLFIDKNKYLENRENAIHRLHENLTTDFNLLNIKTLIISAHSGPKPTNQSIFRISIAARDKTEYERYIFAHIAKIFKLGKLDKHPYSPEKINYCDDTIFYNKEIEYTYFFNGFKFEFFAHLIPNKPLVVFMPAAIYQDKSPLPIFFRWSWHKEIEASCIFLNDPTLYFDKKIVCGWFQGTQKNWLIDSTVSIVKNIANKLNIQNSDIIFFGSSAGGFSAIQAATLMPQSMAMVEIPQTNLNTYWAQSEVKKTLSACYGDIECSVKFPERLSVIESIKNKRRFPDMTVYHSMHDIKSLNQISELFNCYLACLDDNEYDTGVLNIIFYDSFHPVKGGHTPPPKSYTIKNINSKIADVEKKRYLF